MSQIIIYLQQLTLFGIKIAHLKGKGKDFDALSEGCLAGSCLMMKAYEFYWDDGKKVSHLIGILPERRKNLRRVTKKSIMNWGRKISGDDHNKNIYFIEVSV